MWQLAEFNLKPSKMVNFPSVIIFLCTVLCSLMVVDTGKSEEQSQCGLPIENRELPNPLLVCVLQLMVHRPSPTPLGLVLGRACELQAIAK